MTGFPPEYYRTRRPSPLPLILAGAALVLTLYLVWERWGSTVKFTGIVAEPRVVAARGDLMEAEKTTIRVFEENAPSVVHITSPAVQIPDGMRLYQSPEGTGSGFVWDARGFIVTNYHVVALREGRPVVVRLSDGREFEALIVGTSPENDIAVLRLKQEVKGLRPVPVGASRDLKVGQAVFAIGNPFGLDHTLTTGVISALNRSILSLTKTEIKGVIQVDAAINPGNSGGPLLDSAGRLIGMNTAIYSPTRGPGEQGGSVGIGFAVPIDTINEVVPELISTGRSRALLGVQLDNVNLEEVGLAELGRRPRVVAVNQGSGAEASGIRAQEYRYPIGDILLSVAGHEVHSREDVQKLLSKRSVGEVVPVKVLRILPGQDPQQREFKVELR